MSASVLPVNSHATTDDFEFAALGEAKNYRRSLITEFGPYLRGEILEVGAGIGQMSHELASLPDLTRLDALEPDPKFFARLVDLPPPIKPIFGTVANLQPAELYDGIISVNVLEHIDDHLDELKRLHSHLKNSGHLCLFVPAFPAIYAPIDRSFGHFRRYRKKQLQNLLTEAGFRPLRVDYFNSVGFVAWWLNFCVLKKMSFEAGKVRFYDQHVFPWVHRLERNIRPPFGQSLLAVAGK